jgi:hypothetical protein
MVIAGTVCLLVALVVLVNIESWRRRTVAQYQLDTRRQAARERAWDAVAYLDGGD